MDLCSNQRKSNHKWEKLPLYETSGTDTSDLIKLILQGSKFFNNFIMTLCLYLFHEKPPLKIYSRYNCYNAHTFRKRIFQNLASLIFITTKTNVSRISNTSLVWGLLYSRIHTSCLCILWGWIIPMTLNSLTATVYNRTNITRLLLPRASSTCHTVRPLSYISLSLLQYINRAKPTILICASHFSLKFSFTAIFYL